MKHLIVFLALVSISVTAYADLRIFTCEPEWAALAEELGGELVDTTSATTALQDPHYIQARPSLIANVRRADLVICSGSQLEIGWLPALLQKANNPDVSPGASGYFEASSFVERMEATANVDRSQGDIHPEGNPHVQTDPRNIAIIATELGARMQQLDPDNASDYANPPGRLHDSLERSGCALGITTHSAEREARHSSPQVLGLSRTLDRPRRGRDARGRSRHPADIEPLEPARIEIRQR